MGFLDFLSAGASGVATGLQTHDALEQRKREQAIEDSERDAVQRKRVLEEALLQLNIDNARKPPEQAYDVTVDGMRGTFRTPEEAASFRSKYDRPDPSDKPEAPYAVNIDGMSGRFNTPEEAAAFRDRYSRPDAPPAPPAAVQERLARNRATINRIDEAIRAIGQRPESLGMRNMLPEMVTQRMDPEGVATRALLADIGSLIILDRSGAAVAIQEMERLKPFLPAQTDTPQVAITKLRGLQQNLQGVMAEMENPGSGARPAPSVPPMLARPAASGAAGPDISTMSDEDFLNYLSQAR